MGGLVVPAIEGAMGLYGAYATWRTANQTLNAYRQGQQNQQSQMAPPPADGNHQADKGAKKLPDAPAAVAGQCCGPDDPNNKDESENKWKGRGNEYEEHVRQELNADGKFRAGGREYDGKYTDANGQNTWYDAKSSWDYTNNAEDMQNFKSTTGQQAGIAANNGANFAIVTPVDPPANLQSWLDAKGVQIVKVP